MSDRPSDRRTQPPRLLAAFLRDLGRVIAAPYLAARHLLAPKVPRQTILELDLEDGLIEYKPDDPFVILQTRKMALVRGVVEALYRAASDDRVKALVAHVGSAPLGLAHAEEVRDAVNHFRASGKPAVLFAETFGEMGPGHAGYYLATAFDQIFLQPSGDVGLTGLIVEQPFLKGALDKVGIEPRLDHRHEYKNALNLFTEEAFTEAHRQSVEGLASSLMDNLVTGIAAGRSLTPERVREVIDTGPLSARDAHETGLVDGLAYRDEVYAQLEVDFPEARLLYHHVYLQRAGRPFSQGRGIALVYGVGTIRRGSSTSTLTTPGTTMGASTVTRALRSAIDDPSIAAIVLRVDSPGGSYIASDAIWRETVRAREAGKPVVVSMANVAASGGYFVAASAARIVAQPSTITGSIGVVGGKFLLRRLWDKLGVTWDDVTVGQRAGMWSTRLDYSDEEWAHLQRWLDRVYADFTAKVARGRGLDQRQVEAVARGRVWSGRDALEAGLVDELGGLLTAIRLAREEAGIDPAADVHLRVLPRTRSLLDRLRPDRPSSSDDYVTSWSSLHPSLESTALADLIGGLSVTRPPAELEMPALRVR